ncbi:MAG: 50S ribosomal protein L25/general stress protein Ctc [Actinomycetota bacterium]|jgi:large subunit ribosomal protein L25|nr:50S ribosomal protein L25/general stress protein Ctc [Actinomycetota bacterium]MDA2948562.1 50S ribosomal protein L25/general stress protein Ctc [Actinomycetota bacterium]MDA2992306.1 50S ribosomal protein L25/general stress protein Ctc [Actinomycetota bacterium]
MAKAATTNKLTVDVRTSTGKGASRRARREGKVPAVLYGHGSEPQHLELNARDFAAVLRHSGTNAVLVLDVNGQEQLALTKALAIHPIRRTITHADLIIVRRGEKVTVEVSVVVEGEAESGTLVTQDATTIEIEAEALSIPESLTVSVEGVGEGTQILAGEVPLPSGVTLVSDPEMLVVNIVAAPSAEELESEGGGESLEEQATEAAEAAAEGESAGSE